jgi:hypothetical protein
MWHAVRGHGARVPEPAMPGRSPCPRARAGMLQRCVNALALMLALSTAGTAQRPFEHERHEAVVCTACHGAGTEHRTLLVRSAADCASCHHDESRALSCSRCHESRSLPQSRSIVQSWDADPAADGSGSVAVARQRTLSFSHALHAGEACRSCHDTGTALAVTRTCASCHEHHRAEADCVLCHGTDVRATHRAEAHLSCTSAGCHAGRSLPPLDASRMLCIACHVAQTDHEPGGACASCHQVPRAAERS